MTADVFGGPVKVSAALLGATEATPVRAGEFVPRDPVKTPGAAAALGLVRSKGVYLGGEVKNEIVQAFDQIPPARHEQFLLHLDDLLTKKTSWTDLSLRFGVAAETGYLLVDSTLNEEHRNGLRDPSDTRGWSDSELRTYGRILRALPPSLRNLPSLTVVERDQNSMVEYGSEVLGLYSSGDAASKVFDPQVNPAPLLELAERLSGRPWNQRTFIHEFGHAVAAAKPELAERWGQHFEKLGARVASPTCYGTTDAGEGFADSFWLFSVAPKLLRENAPETYQFFKEEFGDSLKEMRNPAISLAVAILGKEGLLIMGRPEDAAAGTGLPR